MMDDDNLFPPTMSTFQVFDLQTGQKDIVDVDGCGELALVNLRCLYSSHRPRSLYVCQLFESEVHSFVF
jgi:hypothetical protein